MNKYQVTAQFEMDDEFMSHVPAHRTYINQLIEDGVIDYYAVSLENNTVWIVVNAATKEEAEQYLDASPLRPYWTLSIYELFVFDGQSMRLPALQLN
jgi:hypothetical protein